MMNFDSIRLAALALSMASSLTAADVSLRGDGRLTGEVTAIDGEGTIELVSPFSKKPLLIKGEEAIRVDFGNADDTAFVSDQRVELINGDVLPVKVISLADGLLNVASTDLGEISIPRAMISSIQLGLYPERVVYTGAKNFKGWKRDKGGSESWTIEDGEFLARGQGSLSRDVGLPEKFILRFTVAWNNYPNFQFQFGESKRKESAKPDRYFLQLIGAGLGIYRTSPDKSGDVPIVLMNRSSGSMRNSRMEIEIRVDRSRSQIQLYVDGEMEGRYTDPVQGVPSGTGISLVSRAPRESGLRVGGIQVLEWDDRSDRHRTEERGDGKSDSLIGRYGERLGGKLTGIRRDGETSVYLFKSDFQKEVLELADQEVSTVFIGGEAATAEKRSTGGFTLGLRGRGEMQVSSCIFGSDQVTTEHPLLGSVEIDRSGITSLQRRKSRRAKPVKSR